MRKSRRKTLKDEGNQGRHQREIEASGQPERQWEVAASGGKARGMTTR